MKGPLAGIRILDLSHVWAGPLAVRYLSDLGAEVVRVEAPFSRGPREFPSQPLGGWLGGEPGDEPWNRNAIFVKLMRNRRSICLDLKIDAGREIFLELVAECDVLLENFSSRVMPSLGLSYETLCAVNERLIYVTMPGFGHNGELKERVAFGPTVEAMSGLTGVFGYGSDEPRNTAMALMDPISAMNAIAGVVTALKERERTGLGLRMEMSLHEGGVAYSGPWLIDHQLGANPECVGNRHPEMCPHGVFACAGDDNWLAIACVDDADWSKLAKLLDLDPSLSLRQRREFEEQIEDAIVRFTQDLTKEEAAERLQAIGIPAGPVNNVPEMVNDPQVAARGFFVPIERFDTPMPGTPLKMAGVNPEAWTPCPRLGQDNVSVLQDWLGKPVEEIEELEEQEVLFSRPPS